MKNAQCATCMVVISRQWPILIARSSNSRAVTLFRARQRNVYLLSSIVLGVLRPDDHPYFFTSKTRRSAAMAARGGIRCGVNREMGQYVMQLGGRVIHEVSALGRIAVT